MAQFFTSDSSPFYRGNYPRPPKLDKGNFGPALFGRYQQRWDPVGRQWIRPDGSRAALAGFGVTLPELDLTPGAQAPALLDPPTFTALATALVLGLGGGWALQHRYKTVGGVLLFGGGIAAVTALFKLKSNHDAQVAYADWHSKPQTSAQAITGGLIAPQMPTSVGSGRGWMVTKVGPSQ